MGYGNLILFILREFRKFFYNKKIKKTFSIIILFFAIYLLLSFIGILPDKVAFGAEVITSSYYYDGISATYRDYEGLQNDFCVRVLRDIRDTGSIPVSLKNTLERLTNGGFITLFYYGDALGSNYVNTSPSVANKNIIEVIQMDASQVVSNVNEYNWGLNRPSRRSWLCM